MCGPLPNVKHDESQETPAWSDEGAPYPSEKFDFTEPVPWLVLIAAVATVSVLALNAECRAASVFWIVYECYIVFDHAPFLFTTTVYKSPAFNYRRVNLIFFWGMESVACIVATQSLVGAPCILLYNAMPHFFFVGAHVNQTATSKAFVPSQMKTWWINAQVTIDNIIHLACLWYHLKYISAGFVPLLAWTGLVGSMLLLTLWVHADEMSWSYLFVVAGSEGGRAKSIADDPVDEASDSCSSVAPEPLPVEAAVASAATPGIVGDRPRKKRRVSTDLYPRPLPQNINSSSEPRNATEKTRPQIPPNDSPSPPLEVRVHARGDGPGGRARRDVAAPGGPPSPDGPAEEGATTRCPADGVRGVDVRVAALDGIEDRFRAYAYILGKPAFDTPSSGLGDKTASLSQTAIPMPATLRLRTNRARMA